MKEIFADLWQTKLEIPFGAVHAHAYFLQRPEGNVLIYSTGHAEEIARIAEMGGIKYQYLSHRHESGPSLQTIKQRFSSTLCCDEKERSAISESCEVDLTFSENARHFPDIRIISTPGHTDGGTSFLYESPSGQTFLFTGDTFIQSNGQWHTIVSSSEGGSSEVLIESLQIYRELGPDVVLWSASRGPRSFVDTTEAQWKEDIDNAIAKLRG